MTEGLQNPVVFFQHYAEDNAEDLQIKSAADMGALIFDGLCDGIFLFNQGGLSHAVVDATAFGILQAGRTRTSKTEYISCPGCGRTLYDLEKTIARIKAASFRLEKVEDRYNGMRCEWPRRNGGCRLRLCEWTEAKSACIKVRFAWKRIFLKKRR